ncbi:MAG: phosphate transport system protein [Puniceicoccaceae bacterium 5H]|nr:MAG: phosphate transport system protein [Puniceicoccaceae bacterium 5H]
MTADSSDITVIDFPAMRRFYHSELEAFRSNLVLMGEKAIEQVRFSMRALIEQQPEFATRVLELDDEVDALEKEIDNEGIRYISLRSPVASDLRLITTGMKAGHDLERVGDEASTIAKRTLRILNTAPHPSLNRLPELGELAVEMLRDSIDCFLNEDAERAVQIPPRDGQADAIHREIYKAYGELMAEHADQVQVYLDLVFVAKSLERIADHATNLAEEVVYMYRAQDLRHNDDMKRVKRAQRKEAEFGA